MNLVLLGSGRVATVLGRRSLGAGHRIVQVFGRNRSSVEMLAGELNARPVLSWEQINCTEALLYIVCLPDAVVSKLHEQWRCTRGLVVHTAGSVAMTALSGVSANYGVLYPLQSLTETTTRDVIIPLLVEANTPDDTALLTDFAASLGSPVKHAVSPERLQYHLAAVTVNNFANHLYRLAFELLEGKGLEPAVLHPLIMETAQRVLHQRPEEVQTGPARRNDAETVKAHLAGLGSNAQLQDIYRLFSEQIAELYRR